MHPETRKAVQGEIINWMVDGEDDAEPKTILWLSGPAGAGKTAIAGSIAETCEEKGLLAGSFFFSSFSTGEERRSKRCLVATLVYCMLQHEGLQPLRPLILSVIERDPAIFRKRLKDQLKALLMRPFHDIRGNLNLSSIPRVIIVDGLDEVEAANSRVKEDKLEARERNEGEQVEILSALLELAQHPSIPFRILIVSRPERAIRNFFDSDDAKLVTRHIFIDGKYDPASDIMLYLKAKFSEVRRRYRLSPSWPTEKTLTELVDRASGQFIYASTVVRFITQNGTAPTQERLETILGLRLNHCQPHPLASLDAVYLHILMSSPNPILATRWLGVFDYGLGPLHARFVRKCLEDYSGQAEHLLENLASLVYLPPAEDYGSPYSLFHKSLSDFLQSARCGQELRSAFWDGREHLAHRRFADILKSTSSHETLMHYTESDMNVWDRREIARGNLRRNGMAMAHVHATIFGLLNTSPFLSALDCGTICKERSRYVRCLLVDVTHPADIGEAAYFKVVQRWAGSASAGEKNVLEKAHNLWAYFEPPPAMAAPRGPGVPATVEHDFEPWFTAADQMYSRLPSDWKLRYRQGLAEGQSPYTVLRATLQTIRNELGIDIEDVEIHPGLRWDLEFDLDAGSLGVWEQEPTLCVENPVDELGSRMLCGGPLQVARSFLSATMSSSYFSHSTNYLQDNTFITATNYINQPGSAKGPFERQLLSAIPSQPRLLTSQLADLLGNICADAVHNSDARCDAPKCHPQTRKAVQGEIINWMIDGEDDAEQKTILWLSGPAGAGKTAIAGSIAETCEEKGLLAGSFFFSSFSTEEERRSKRCLVATLVYCMLQHEGMQPLRPVILSIIERDPAIFRKRDLSVSSIPKVIIVDGLDEVEAADSRQLEDKLEARDRNESDQLDILSALLELAKHPSVPFRIVVVSRPERAIRDFFDSEDAKVVTRHIFLDDKYNPASDIMLYLKAKFAEVRRRYRLPPSWPTEKALTELVNRASGQFVYASTVVRFITQNGTIPPQERLERILSLRLHGGQSHPLASLDTLYLHILMSSPDPPLAARWLGVIDYGLGPLHAPFVRKCLEDYRGQAEHLLENLASLVHLPPAQDYFSPYRLFHKSLSDFLQSSRCNEELRSPFLHGRGHFVHRRFADILKRKAPAVSFERTDWPWHTFMCQFLDCMAFLDFFKTWSMEPTAKQVLATCDVAWWVAATIVAFMRAERPSPTNPSPDPATGLRRASLTLCKLMLQIHMQVSRSITPFRVQVKADSLQAVPQV
ncbi:hypothetical protein NMY22_g16227 [Coprinellus aureogranulatus]|nr:hypothetical protein NMY22_g16227 [Coprinellus aureogranulatus]